MTTKTEMTLENVCFLYDDNDPSSAKCIRIMNEKYETKYQGHENIFYWIRDNGRPFWDKYAPDNYVLIMPSDYLLLLSAPESQAHLLTEKDSNDMAHVSEHLSAIEYLRQPSLKELSKPPVMEGKATFEKSERFIQILKEGNEGHEFREVIDGLMNEQILECIEQYKNEHISSLQSEVEQLKGLLRESKIFCGGSLQARIDNYLSK